MFIRFMSYIFEVQTFSAKKTTLCYLLEKEKKMVDLLGHHDSRCKWSDKN